MNDSTPSHDPEPTLYPESTPRATGMLAVDALHKMYWEECGAADGVPLLFIHGGPGGGSLPHHRRFYDPAFWKIVLYDQRGAGRSTPAAELAGNTTQHLVADLERLRTELRGMRNTFPEAWHAFAEALPPAERADMLESYYRRLIHPDPKIHLPAAHAWD